MNFITEVEKKLDLPPGEKAEVLRELKSHYEELRAGLMASGIDAETASMKASRQLGDPADVAQRMQTVHCRATWKTAWLTAFPFIPSIVWILLAGVVHRPIPGTDMRKYLVQQLIFSCVFGTLLLAGSIRELLRNRRPLWLATWLPFGLMALANTANLVEIMIMGMAYANRRISIGPIILILMLGAAAAIAFRKSTKWSLILMGLTILSELAYLAFRLALLTNGWFQVFLLIITAPLVIAAALGIFARHPYGNTSQASLSLFGFYALIGPSAVLYGPNGSSMQSPWLLVFVSLLSPLTMIAAVLAFARSGVWGQKLLILAGCLVARYLLSVSTIVLLPYQPGLNWPFHIALSTTQVLFILLWVVLVPILFQRRWSERKSGFVR